MPHDRLVLHLCRGPERHTWLDPADAAKCCNGFVRAHRITRDANGDAVLVYYWAPMTTRRPSPSRRQATRWTISRLSHAAWFERLAEVADTAPEWQVIKAGLLTLRLVDKYVADALRGIRLTHKEFVAVRHDVEALPPSAMRRVLRRIILTAATYESGALPPLSPILTAMGELLERRGEYSLAADVYGTLAEYANSRRDQEAVPHAYVRMGACLRRLDRLADAATAYRLGRSIAERLGAFQATLHLDLGLAEIDLERGDYAAATAALDALIAEAAGAGRGPELTPLLAAAYHDRGVAALHRGDPAAALHWLADALTEAKADLVHRQRIAIDVAKGLACIGLGDAARTVCAMLAEHATLRELRSMATITHLGLAGADRNEAEFDAVRARLDNAALSPRSRALYALALADGNRRLGRPTDSTADPLPHDSLEMIPTGESVADDVIESALDLISQLRRDLGVID
jgi:tetratricopeptide (TPR) repeat protein